MAKVHVPISLRPVCFELRARWPHQCQLGIRPGCSPPSGARVPHPPGGAPSAPKRSPSARLRSPPARGVLHPPGRVLHPPGAADLSRAVVQTALAGGALLLRAPPLASGAQMIITPTVRITVRSDHRPPAPQCYVRAAVHMRGGRPAAGNGRPSFLKCAPGRMENAA